MELDASGDVLEIALIAAATGAFASFVAELIITRGETRETGLLEHPKSGSRFIDLGSWASVPVGILAGVVAAFLFAPGEERIVDDEVVRDVELGELLLVSALAGLAGTGFLAAMQERFLATLKTKQAEAKVQDAVKGLLNINKTAKDTDRAKRKAAEAKQGDVHDKLKKAREQTSPRLAEAFRQADSAAEHKLRELGMRDEVLELSDGPAMTDDQLSTEAAGVVDEVAGSAAQALSDQVTSQVDQLLATLGQDPA